MTVGVLIDGEVANTKAPLPVSSVTADAKLADDGVAKNVATLAAKPDTPVEIGRPVQLVRVPEDGVPKAGVTRVGEVANTKAPLPVSSVTAVIKLADDGVARNAATPAPKPETPVEIGKPVQLVRVPEAGVPKAGVTRVGDVANTKAPLPVSSDITPSNSEEVVAANTLSLLPVVVKVPAVGNVTLEAAVVVRVRLKAPEVARVDPSAKVKVAAVAGAVKATLLMLVAVATPNTGVTRVGDVANTFTPVPVLSVKADAKLDDDGVPKNVATLAPKPETPVEIGRPVQLVRVPEEGVPKAGVTRVGEVANTKAPVPVSSVTAVIKFADDGVAKNAATPAAKPDTPVEIGRPVQLVRVPEDGVPKAGVTRVGEVANTKAPLPVSSVTAVIKFADEGVAKNVATPAPNPETPVEIGKPVQLVRVPEAGVPKAGVTRVGDVANTKAPVPVLSDITPANSDDEVDANTLSLLPVVVKVPAVGNVTLEAAVVVRVKLKPPEVANVELLANVNVAADAGAVTVTLLKLVALRLSVEGTYFNVASDETATPEPPFVLENKMK